MLETVLNHAAALFLGFMLLGSALHKAGDLPAFRAVVGQYALLPAWMVPGVAAGLMVAEILLGAAVILPPSRAAAALGAALLLGAYLAAMGVNLVRGRRDLDCGCSFLRADRPVGAWHLLRNIVLVGMAWFVSAGAPGAAPGWFGWIVIAGAAVSLSLVYVVVEQLLANRSILKRLVSPS